MIEEKILIGLFYCKKWGIHMSKLIDYLESIGILTQEQLLNYVKDNDIKTLNGLILYMRQLIDEDYMICEYSPFNLVPSGDISGMGGCGDITCRTQRASMFSVFSALYADKVYLQLDFIVNAHNRFMDIDMIGADAELSKKYKRAFYREMSVLLVYTELIRNNIVCITPTHKMLCSDCFQDEMFGKKVIDIEKIKKEYCSKAKMFLYALDSEHQKAAISISNVEEFFSEHPVYWYFDDAKTVKVLEKEKVGKIIKQQAYFKKLKESFIVKEILSAMYIAKYCNEQRAKVITNKLSDGIFLAINDNKQNMADIKKTISSLPQYDLLITNNLELKNVIRLRQEESEAFNKYRVALSKAVAEQNKTNNVGDWHRIYDDIIYPELNNLDMKMKQIKTGKMNKFFGSMLIVGTAIVANKYGDALKAELLSDIGLSVGAAGINSLIDKSSNQKAELQNNDYFFLWKLKKMSEKKEFDIQSIVN